MLDNNLALGTIMLERHLLDVSLVEGIEIMVEKKFEPNENIEGVSKYNDKESKLLIVNKFDPLNILVEEYKKEDCLKNNLKEILFSLAFSWNLDRTNEYDVDLAYWSGEINSIEDVFIAVISQMTADAYNFNQDKDETINENIKMLPFIDIDDSGYVNVNFKFRHPDYIKMFERILNIVKYDWDGEFNINKSNMFIWNYMNNIADENINLIEEHFDLEEN